MFGLFKKKEKKEIIQANGKIYWSVTWVRETYFVGKRMDVLDKKVFLSLQSAEQFIDELETVENETKIQVNAKLTEELFITNNNIENNILWCVEVNVINKNNIVVRSTVFLDLNLANDYAKKLKNCDDERLHWVRVIKRENT